MKEYMKTIIQGLLYHIKETFYNKIEIDEKINKKANQENLDNHIQDNIVHITEDERVAWNAIEENVTTYVDEKIDNHTYSWNDLEDKPFYVVKPNLIFSSQQQEALPDDFSIEIGKTYTVICDGISYVLVGAWGTTMSAETFLYIGNATLICADYTDGREYPFVIYTNSAIPYNPRGIAFEEYAVEHTLELYDGEIIIQYLDEQYIPNTIARTTYIDEQLAIKADKTTLDNYYLKTEADNLHTEVLEYVDTEIAALVNAAPETLDTIGELAAAFKENQDMIATLDAAITTKANQTDLETTQNSVSTNTTNIATLQSQVLSNSLIVADAITGALYTIQIQNGQLVSFPVEE